MKIYGSDNQLLNGLLEALVSDINIFSCLVNYGNRCKAHGLSHANPDRYFLMRCVHRGMSS